MATITTSSGQTVTAPTENIPGMTYETAKPATPVEPVATAPVESLNEPVQSAPVTETTPEIIDTTGIQENLNTAFANANNPDAIANKAFLEGAYKASGQQYTREQINNLGLEYVRTQEQLEALGEDRLVRFGNDVYTFGGRQPSLMGSLDFFGLSKNLPGYGITEEKIEDNVPDAGAGTNAQGEQQDVSVGGKNKTLQERIDEYSSVIGGIKSDKAEEVGLEEKNTAVLLSKKKIDDMKNTLDFNKILDIGAKNERFDVLDEGIDALTVSGQLASTSAMRIGELVKSFNTNESRLTRDQTLSDANDIYKYNTEINNYNMLSGQAELAQKAVTESADSFREYRAMAIEDMAIQQNLDEIEKLDLLQKNNEMWAKESVGYSPISPENYEDVVREYGENRIYTDAYGDSYLKPQEGIFTDFELQSQELAILSQKLGIESQLLENKLIGDDSYQVSVTTNDGMYRVTYDKTGNEINRSRIGDTPISSSSGEKITATQSQAAGFAARIEQTETIMNDLANIGTGEGLFTLTAAKYLPELLKTDNRKRFEQASRNFINAVLRRESGAAIAPSEFESAEKQYLPAIGDGDEVLKQKADNRKIVLESLKLESGNAYVSAENLIGMGGVDNTEDLFN